MLWPRPHIKFLASASASISHFLASELHSYAPPVENFWLRNWRATHCVDRPGYHLVLCIFCFHLCLSLSMHDFISTFVCSCFLSCNAAGFAEDGGSNTEIPNPEWPDICFSEQIPEFGTWSRGCWTFFTTWHKSSELSSLRFLTASFNCGLVVSRVRNKLWRMLL